MYLCLGSQLAIAAKHHGIPFYVAAPSTSCDLSLESGRDIIIEVRPPEELTSINGVPIAAPGKKWDCWWLDNKLSFLKVKNERNRNKLFSNSECERKTSGLEDR